MLARLRLLTRKPTIIGFINFVSKGLNSVQPIMMSMHVINVKFQIYKNYISK